MSTTSPAWHALSGGDVVSLLDTDAARGLGRHEAAQRLARVGPNRVGEHRETPLWRLALAQFRSLVVLLLLGAAGIAWGLGERLEAVAIFAALVLNALIGFATEARARRSLSRLRALAVPHAIVRREGTIVCLPAADLVPGDIVVLEAGAHVPADARLLRSAALRVTEAALTGESEAVDKDADAKLEPGAPLAERRTTVYLATSVVSGSGLAVVTATGLATELGRIGQLVGLAGERTTPLERQVEQLGRRLIVLALAICGVVGLVGILHSEPVWLMLETAISLAIAAIPEGLPAMTTVALAAGLWRLARAGALVRRLPAVETLGSTTVICADKTGTMTENRMTVVRIILDGRDIVIAGGVEPLQAEFREDGVAIDPARDTRVNEALKIGALVNDARIEHGGAGVTLHGDPTETALLVAAVRGGIELERLALEWPRRNEVPFDPALRLMATFNESPDGRPVLLVKGGPGAVLERSTRLASATGPRALAEADRERLRALNVALAGEGLRVLAVAWRPEGWPADGRIDDLTFVGLLGLQDPVKPGVKEAIAQCAAAGIQTVMLTGDQRATAEAVGHQLGLPADAIRSRVSPEDKLELIKALQARGEIVAMTGDGVNDAPALARADIGVAMGGRGTDVAREASDVVLTDDDFATIVRAVAQGRVIYANLRKVIHFLFTANLSEIATIFVAVALGFPAPLLPLQILWVNLVTDILPALALIRDPAEPDVMRRPPRDPRQALVTWRFGRRMLAEGFVLAAGVLSAYLWVVWRDGAGPHANTVALVALVLIHPLQAMYCRSTYRSWWRLPPNVLTWVALITLVGAQWLAVSWTPFAALLRTQALSLADWGTVAVAVIWPMIALEGVKGGLSPRASSAPHRGETQSEQACGR
jgi:P-type Ca2+ transporter type 2C